MLGRRLSADRSSEERSELYLPEIQRKRSRRRRRFIAVSFFLLVYLAILGCLRLILWTPVFKLKSFEIAGAVSVTKEDLVNFLRQKVLDAEWKHILGFDNILVWPETLSPEKASHLLPALKNLKIHRNYRERSVRLEVEERNPFGIWCLMKPETPECFWFDEEGVILARAPLAEGSLIPSVNDYSQGKIMAGGKVLPGGQIQNFFSILRVIAAARMEVKEIRLEDAALSEIKVLTYGGPTRAAGPELYFSLRFPATSALAVLNSFRSATGTSGLEKLEYIDFRAENRAYYK